MKFSIPLLVLLIFLSSISMASDFGPSQIRIERVWTVDNVGQSPVDFTGALVLNDSNQQVISVTVDPGMNWSTDENGSIKVSYHTDSAPSTLVLHASALVHVNYNTHILSDSVLPASPAKYSNLTIPNAQITRAANSLQVKNSSLKTILNTVNWVHDYVTYDLAYFGKTISAAQVFAQKRGVCVEYTELLLSMLQSDGLRTRYVAGYVNPGGWQAHAWAEIYIPGYGWIPADATYGEIGILDNSHIAFSRGSDQNDIFDSLSSQSSDAILSVNDTVTMLSSSADAHGLEAFISMNNQTHTLNATLSNNRQEYVYGTYVYLSPNQTDSSIVLLNPLAQISLAYSLNNSEFQSGYIYTIPVSLSLDDAFVNNTFQIRTATAPPIPTLPLAPKSSLPCASAFILLFFGLLTYSNN